MMVFTSVGQRLHSETVTMDVMKARETMGSSTV